MAWPGLASAQQRTAGDAARSSGHQVEMMWDKNIISPARSKGVWVAGGGQEEGQARL